MNRFAKAWKWLTGAAEQKLGEGVLFGIDPPEGCQFKVTCYEGDSWHVRVLEGGRELVHECAVRRYDGIDDEALITSAARRALAAHARLGAVSELEGLYPPKRAEGKRAK